MQQIMELFLLRSQIAFQKKNTNLFFSGLSRASYAIFPNLFFLRLLQCLNLFKSFRIKMVSGQKQ